MSFQWNRLPAKLLTPWVDAYRFHANTRGLARQLAEREYWSPEQLRQWQVAQLRPFLQHCYDNCPFYRRRFQEVGFRPQDFEDLSQMAVIPPLTKNDIRENKEDLFSRLANRRRMKRGSTGGSTGEPTSFYISYDEAAWTRALTLRYMEWAGIQPGDKIVRMSGLRFTSDWRDSLIRFYFNHVENTVSLPCAAVNPQLLDEYIEKISSYRATVLWGYPTAIYLLASRLQEMRQKLPHVQRLWLSSEVLTEHQRKTIRNAFEIEPFDIYGGGDGHVAGECEAHEGKHINQHARLIEVVGEDCHAVKATEAGRVLVTSFFNYDWPYVRYDMGDVAEVLPESECPCGRRLPKIGRILGRTGDQVLTREGLRATVPNFNNLFSPICDQVQLYQIVQHTLDHVEVRIVPTSSYKPKTEKIIEKGLRRFLGDTILIQISTQQDVEQTRIGKRRLVISHLPIAA